MPNGQPKYNNMTLDDQQIRAISRNAKILAQFPFLKSVNATSGGCGRCGRKASVKTEAFTAAKQAIAAMDDTKKALLKSLLSAREVSLVYREGTTVKRTTF